MGLSNSSLGYLNYPTQIIFKCCKLIPVLIGGIIIQKKKYTTLDFAACACMSIGLIFFTLADSSVSPSFSLYGLMLICSALVADAVIGNVQEKTMKEFSSSNSEMILYSYSIGFVYILFGQLATGQFWSAFSFCWQHPFQTYGYALIFSFTGYIGLVVVLSLVKSFGALIAVTGKSTILYEDLLDAKIHKKEVTIGFIRRHKSKNILKVDKVSFHEIEGSNECTEFVDNVLSRAKNYWQRRPTKLKVIVNPQSGTLKKGERVYKEVVQPIFESARIVCETEVTQSRKHAQEILSKCCLNDFDGVVSVGGDGTFTECYNGMILNQMACAKRDINDRRSQLIKPPIPIGIIPLGSGQGCIKMAIGSVDVVTAALHIVIGKSFSAKGYSVHSGTKLVYYGNLLFGYGFYSDLIEEGENKRWMGILRYGFGGTKAFFKHRLFKAKIRVLPWGSTPKDGALDSNLNNDHEKEFTDEFFSVEMYPFLFPLVDRQLETYSLPLCSLYMLRSCSRIDHLQLLAKLARKKDDTYSFDFVKSFEAEGFSLAIEPDPDNREENNSIIINIDGDPFPVKREDVIHVKMYADMIDIYGPSASWNEIKELM
ncbi:DgyrCDS1189 [Dimorphilus gyrociliatus]|uniref:DgyrCDS1189 n=1 Tax=Dimorphilus gyrociliatus TaxID=2664684 RepID=A0A7I8V9N8_9ANNE|nr:DgyrCDS1189 [Dimorphilus gyrociliatus]